MNKFDVLGTMRAIRNDKTLTATQAHLLMCAVLRTDNGTCHVRYSIEGLAEDGNVSYKTAKTAFQQSEVRKYFVKEVRSKRQVDLWFYPAPIERVTVTPSEGNPVHRGGNGYPPSTCSSTFTTSTGTVADAPVPTTSKLEVKEVLGKSRYSFSYRNTQPSLKRQTHTPIYIVSLNDKQDAVPLMATPETDRVIITPSDTPATEGVLVESQPETERVTITHSSNPQGFTNIQVGQMKVAVLRNARACKESEQSEHWAAVLELATDPTFKPEETNPSSRVGHAQSALIPKDAERLDW